MYAPSHGSWRWPGLIEKTSLGRVWKSDFQRGREKDLIQKGTFNNFHNLIWPEDADDQLFACILGIAEWFAEPHFLCRDTALYRCAQGREVGQLDPLTPLSIAPPLAVPKQTGSKLNRRNNTLVRFQPNPWRSYRAHLIWMRLFSYF